MTLLTIAMAAEWSNCELSLWSSPIGVPNYQLPDRKMVSEVQITFIWKPKSTQTRWITFRGQYKKKNLNVLPLSIVCITVALKLWVNTGLVDSTATLLDFSESPTPVIVTFIVAANPVRERSPICYEIEAKSFMCFVPKHHHSAKINTDFSHLVCSEGGTCSRSSRSTAHSTWRCWQGQ